MICKVKVKVSPRGTGGLEIHCILGTAGERQGPSLFFLCLSLPRVETDTQIYCLVDREVSSRQMDGETWAGSHNLPVTFCAITKRL